MRIVKIGKAIALKNLRFAMTSTLSLVSDSPPLYLKTEQLQAVERDRTEDLSHSLINETGQDVVYFGVFFLVVSLITAMGILSRKVAWAILFALVLSILMIIVLWLF